MKTFILLAAIKRFRLPIFLITNGAKSIDQSAALPIIVFASPKEASYLPPKA